MKGILVPPDKKKDDFLPRGSGGSRMLNLFLFDGYLSHELVPKENKSGQTFLGFRIIQTKRYVNASGHRTNSNPVMCSFQAHGDLADEILDCCGIGDWMRVTGRMRRKNYGGWGTDLIAESFDYQSPATQDDQDWIINLLTRRAERAAKAKASAERREAKKANG